MKYEPKGIRGNVGCSPAFYHEFRKLIKGKVVELGCGINKFRDELLADKEIEWTGIDYDENAKPTIKLRLDNSVTLPFPDKSIDIVLAIHSLDHLDSSGLMRTLSESKRILKPGGIILFEVGQRGNQESGDQDGHWIDFTGTFGVIVHYLEQAGFKHIGVSRIYNGRLFGFARGEIYEGIVGSKVEQWESISGGYIS